MSEVAVPRSYHRSPCPVLNTVANGSDVTVDRSATDTAGARQSSPLSGRDGSSDAPVQNRSSAAWKSPGARRSPGRWLRVHSGRYRPIDVMCAASRGTIASQFSDVFQPFASTSTPAHSS